MTKKWPLLISVILFVMLVLSIIFYVIFPLKYKKEINTYSAEYSLEPGLVASVIFVESRFKPNAKSSSGACGLMQLMPATFDWIKSQLRDETANIFDAKTNIKYGCYYIDYLMQKHKNLVYVLACYNAGEGVVSAWGSSDSFLIDNIEYAETKNYVKKILKYQRFYQYRMSV